MRTPTRNYPVIFIVILSSLLFGESTHPTTLELSVPGKSTHEFRINSLQIGEYQFTLFRQIHLRYMQSIYFASDLNQFAGGSIGVSHRFRDNIFSFQIGTNGQYGTGVYHRWLVIGYERTFFDRLTLTPQLIPLREKDQRHFLPAGGICFDFTDMVGISAEYAYRIFYDPDDPVINSGFIFRYGPFATSLFTQTSLPLETSGDISVGLNFLLQLTTKRLGRSLFAGRE